MKKISLIVFLILLILMTACESTIPLYKAFKPDEGSANESLSEVKNTVYSDIENFETIIQVTEGEFIKIDSELLEDITFFIDSFIDAKFDIGYLTIRDGEYKSLMETLDSSEPAFDYKRFISEVEENKVIQSVKAAQIMSGGYVKEYKQNDKIFYVLAFDMILMTTVRNDNFYVEYPYYNKGTTNISVFLYCENDNGVIKIIDWLENYNGNLKTSFNFVSQ